jgi:hypothetical protein
MTVRGIAGDAGDGGAARQVLRQRPGPVAAPAASLRPVARRARAQERDREDSDREGEGGVGNPGFRSAPSGLRGLHSAACMRARDVRREDGRISASAGMPQARCSFQAICMVRRRRRLRMSDAR